MCNYYMQLHILLSDVRGRFCLPFLVDGRPLVQLLGQGLQLLLQPLPLLALRANLENVTQSKPRANVTQSQPRLKQMYTSSQSKPRLEKTCTSSQSNHRQEQTCTSSKRKPRQELIQTRFYVYQLLEQTQARANFYFFQIF